MGKFEDTDLQLQVEFHLAPALVVRVLLQYKLELRLPLVQISIVEKEPLLGFSAGDKRKLVIVLTKRKCYCVLQNNGFKLNSRQLKLVVHKL